MSFELNRKLAAKRPLLATSATIDPVTAAIIRGALDTVCFEAATHLGRSATSPIINQSNERNASIIDAHGRLAAGSIGTPHLTFVSQLTVRFGLERRDDSEPGGFEPADQPPGLRALPASVVALEHEPEDRHHREQRREDGEERVVGDQRGQPPGPIVGELADDADGEARHAVALLQQVDSAEQQITALNPDVRVVKHETRLDASNIMDIIKDYDIVVDGVDNFPTRYLLNDATVRLRIPVVSAAILGFEGQLSVFAPYEGPCYRCLFRQPPPAELAPSCGANGVLGVLPGTMGLLPWLLIPGFLMPIYLLTHLAAFARLAAVETAGAGRSTAASPEGVPS